MSAARTPGSTIFLLHGSNREISTSIPVSHGTLGGLSSDDHVQYLLVNGSRPLTGNLNIGNNSIINCNILTTNAVIYHTEVSSLGAGSNILTTTQFAPNSIILKTASGVGDVLTVPSVASIVATYPNIRNNDGFKVVIKNKSLNDISMSPGAGLTFETDIESTISSLTNKWYNIVVTNVGGNTGVLYSI